jgi:hypothetical protein
MEKWNKFIQWSIILHFTKKYKKSGRTKENGGKGGTSPQ